MKGRKDMAINRVIVDDLADQYARAYKMLYAVIDNIPADKWTSGLTEMCIPARIAYHIVDGLDFFFSDKPPSDFPWGHRFTGSWADLPEESLPTKEEMVTYLNETEEIVVGYFQAATDDQLLDAFDLYGWSGTTKLGQLVYALRHTMHHQGELAALQLFSGVEGDSWS
jgi:hypothetical protein